MKKYSILFMIFLTALVNLSAYGQADEGHHGKLGSFESVAIHIPAETEIVKGNTTSVDIEMSERVARQIEVYTSRGTLVIKSKGGSWIKKSDNIKIRITMPYWNSLTLTSSGEIRSEENWRCDEASIRLTGSGNIFLESLQSSSADFSTTGSGDLLLASLDNSDDCVIKSTGSGSIFISRIISEKTEIRLTGSGDYKGELESDTLQIGLSGSGSASVSGFAGKAELQTTGSGKIRGDDLMAEEAYIRITGSGDVSLKDGTHLKEIRMTGSGTFRSI